MAATTATTTHPRLGVQAFWLTASKGIAAALNICLPILLVRLMPQTEYGVLKEALLFVSTTASIAMFGVGMSAFYFMPRYPERGGQVALNILIYNFVVGWIPLLVVVLCPSLLHSLFRTEALGPLAWLLGVMVLLSLSAIMIQQIPTALQDVRYSSVFIVGMQIARVLMLAGAALWFRSVRSIIAASVLNQLMAIVLLFWYLDGKFPRFWAHFDWQFFKEQLAYALPYGLFGMIWVVQKDLDNYFVSASLGPKDYAIYAVGWIEVPLLTLMLESVSSVLIVRISQLQKEGRKADIRYVTAAAGNRLSSLEFPLFAMLFVAGHDLIVLLYTRTYEASANIFLISITLLPICVLLLDPIVRAYKELLNFVLILRICVFVVLFCLLGPAIRYFGMIGAALTAVAMQLLERGFMAWRVARVVDAELRDIRLYADSFKVAAVTIVAGVVAYMVRNLIPSSLLIPRIVAVGLCVAVVYVPCMYVLRLPGWEMLSKDRLKSLLRTTFQLQG